MPDYLRTNQDKLLICNDKLAISCCGGEVQDIYWAAIPCGVETDYRTTCDEVDQCQYINRYFVSYKSLCQDDRLFVCECQRLYFKDYDTMENGPKSNAFVISYTGPNYGIINITSDAITLTENAGSGPVHTTGLTNTLDNLADYIDSFSNWEATNNIASKTPSYILSPVTTNVNSFTFKNIAAAESSFSLSYNGTSTNLIDFDSNPTTLASNIQTALENDLGLFGVEVQYNSNLTNGDVNKYFEIYFGGGLCGLSHSGILLNQYKIISNNTFNSIYNSISGQYANYNLYNGQFPEYWYDGYFSNLNDSYNARGSGSLFAELSNSCPYEQDGDGDVALFNSDVACCPQKGTVLGKLQNITSDYNTYLYDNSEKRFSNLETTVTIQGQCYKVSPFFFLFDRTGRFNNDPISAIQPYITPDCDINGGCDYDVPENCNVELFLAQFHKDIPWGPYGSYYPGIENRNHASVVLGVGYINDSYSSSPEVVRGFQYAPQGTVNTRGTWLETETIDIIFSFKRAMPFYLGTDPFLDLNQQGLVDPLTVGSGLELVQNADCGGPVYLKFACSGKTVRDFVNAVNSVKTLAYSDFPSCNVFAFCLGSTEAGSVPASKIINISNELFDQAARMKESNPSLTYSTAFGGANPLTDINISKADIFTSPQKYTNMWPARSQRSLADNSVLPQDSYTNPYKFVTEPEGGTNEPIQLPPFCRHRMYDLPKQGGFLTFRQNSDAFFGTSISRKITPWFTNIPGKLTDVIKIQSGSGIPSYINKIEFNCIDKVVNITVTSGTTQIQSTGIDTNKFGIEYKISDLVLDLNDLSFKDTSSDNPYWPVVSTGLVSYDIWLDDSTFWDSTTFEPSTSGTPGAVETPKNWSYKEPLLNTSNVNLLGTSAGYLQNWSRQRTEYVLDFTSNKVLNLPHSGCRPLNSRVIEENETIACEGDQFVVDGLLLSYGCSSEICKTEWYLKTTRCSCSLEASCDNGPHLYNQPGNSQANKSTYGGYWVTQPDLYICEYTFHPECDIPMLVKVPMQIVQNTEGNIYLAQYCGDPTYAVQYSDGLADLPFDPEGFLTPSTAAFKWTCGRSFFTDQKNYTSYYDPINSIPFSDYKTTAFCAECVGWCQYIDPTSAPRIKKEDIPREWPPVSYILERGNPAFCSFNLYDVPLSVAAGLDSPTRPVCERWDTIYGVYPALPADKARCNVLGPRQGVEMRVIFRPIVNPLTVGDIRGTADTERIDINCASKCCGCFFKCAPDNPDVNNGPFVCPCIMNISYTRTVTQNGMWAGMCAVTDTNEFLDVYTGECESYLLPVGRVYALPKVANSASYSLSATFNASIDVCCGCRNGDASGNISTSYTANYSACSGPTIPDWEGASYIPPCTSCNTSSYQLLDCGFAASYPPDGSSSSDTLGCQNPPDPGPNGRCYLVQHARAVENANSTVTSQICGTTTANWTSTKTIYRSGTYLGCDLGIFGGDEYHTDEVYTENGSYTQTSITCGTCPVGTQISKDLNYILDWQENSSWICGYSNYSYGFNPTEEEFGSPICE